MYFKDRLFSFLETEAKKHELKSRLKGVKHLILDADDTLVWTEPPYYQETASKTFEKLGLFISPHLKYLINEIKTAEDIGTVARNYLGQDQTGNFWNTFKKVDQIKERLEKTHPFADVESLHNLTDRIHLYMLTHAPSELAEGYTKLIQKKFGIDIPIVQSIHNYENPQSLSKPNPQILFDLLYELNLLPFHFTQQEFDKNPLIIQSQLKPFMKFVAVVGDSSRDIILGQKSVAVPVWINRVKSVPTPPSHFLQFPSLTEMVKAIK